MIVIWRRHARYTGGGSRTEWNNWTAHTAILCAHGGYEVCCVRLVIGLSYFSNNNLVTERVRNKCVCSSVSLLGIFDQNRDRNGP